MCIDLIGRRRAARDCAANLHVVQPIADTDDHPRSLFENATQHQLPGLRMIVNNVESYVSVQSTGLLAPWPSALLILQSFSILGTGKARARARGAYFRYSLSKMELSLAQALSERLSVQAGGPLSGGGAANRKRGNRGGAVVADFESGVILHDILGLIAFAPAGHRRAAPLREPFWGPKGAGRLGSRKYPLLHRCYAW